MGLPTKTTPHEYAVIARKAADLIEGGWCQNALAKDADGTPVSQMDPEAVRFCVVGGLARVQETEWIFSRATGTFANWLSGSRGGLYTHYKMVDWNNDPFRTKGDVVFALREFARIMDQEAK